MSVPSGLPSRRSIETPLLEPFIDLSFLLRASSLVFVATMDLELETINICNSSDEAVRMKGYRLCDANEFHWYEFPDTFVLPAKRTVVVHCCPGKEGPSSSSSHPSSHSRSGSGTSSGIHSSGRTSRSTSDRDDSLIHLQWMNKDGTPRRKNVLNDDKDEIFLFDGASECLSYCVRERGGPAIVTRYTKAAQAATILSRARLAVAYVRIFSLIFGVFLSASDQQRFVVWAMASILFDIIGRCFYVHTFSAVRDYDPLVDSMNSLADRMHTVVMCIKLLSLIGSYSTSSLGDALHLPCIATNIVNIVVNRETILFLLMLEIGSHWMRNCAEGLLPIPLPRLDDARRRLLSQVYSMRNNSSSSGNDAHSNHPARSASTNPTGIATSSVSSASRGASGIETPSGHRTPIVRGSATPATTSSSPVSPGTTAPSNAATNGVPHTAGRASMRRTPLALVSLAAPHADSPYDRSTPLLAPIYTGTSRSSGNRGDAVGALSIYNDFDGNAVGYGVNAMDFIDRLRENSPPLITFVTLMHEIALVSLFASLSDVESRFTGGYFAGDFGLLRLAVFGAAIVGKVLFLTLQLTTSIEMVASEALSHKADSNSSSSNTSTSNSRGSNGPISSSSRGEASGPARSSASNRSGGGTSSGVNAGVESVVRRIRFR